MFALTYLLLTPTGKVSSLRQDHGKQEDWRNMLISTDRITEMILKITCRNIIISYFLLYGQKDVNRKHTCEFSTETDFFAFS